MSGQSLIFGIGPDGKSMVPVQVNAAGQLEVNIDNAAGVLKTLVDVASSTITYVCEAPQGTSTSAAGWRVSRITTSGNTTLTEYAGTGAFDQIAANRASLSYS